MLPTKTGVVPGMVHPLVGTVFRSSFLPYYIHSNFSLRHREAVETTWMIGPIRIAKIERVVAECIGLNGLPHEVG